jgi:hypothetical protein
MLDDLTARRKQAHHSQAERGALGDVRVAVLVGTAAVRAVEERATCSLRTRRSAKAAALALLAGQRADGEVIGARPIRHAAVGASVEITDVIERAILVLVAAWRGVALAGLAAIFTDHVAIRAVDIADSTITNRRLLALAHLAAIFAALEAVLTREVAKDRLARGWRLLALTGRAAVLVCLVAVLALDRRADVIGTDRLGAVTGRAAVLIDEVLFTGEEAGLLFARDGGADRGLLALTSRASVGVSLEAVFAGERAGDGLASLPASAFAKIAAVGVLFVAILAVEPAPERLTGRRGLARASLAAIRVELAAKLAGDLAAQEVGALADPTVASLATLVDLNPEATCI